MVPRYREAGVAHLQDVIDKLYRLTWVCTFETYLLPHRPHGSGSRHHHTVPRQQDDHGSFQSIMAGPSAAVAVLACYLLLPLAQAGSPITPNFAWNITLPATSGMFRFFASGNSSAKWSQTFEGAPQPYAKGQVAVGDGYYNISTTFAGAGSGAVQADAVLRAYGRSVWFNGALTLGNEAYQAFLSPDGNSLPDASPSEPFGSTAGPQLASWSGNAWDYRYWRLGIPSNYTGDLTLRVDSATLETGMELLVE